MLGFVVVLLWSAFVCEALRRPVAKWLPGLQKLEHIGLAGLIGFGLCGVLVFFLGLIPGAIKYSFLLSGIIVPLLILAIHDVKQVFNAGSIEYWKFRELKVLSSEKGKSKLLRPINIIPLALLVSFLGVVTPTVEWDALAYHLAVPKLWLQQGRIEPIPFIHHSHFPFAVDNLYVMGLTLSEEAARSFSFAYLLFGMIAVLGVSARHFGSNGGYLSAIAFAFSPVVLWESSTAYIDVAHGLYAGLGLIYTFEYYKGKCHWLLPAILLGLGVASKNTGLQVAFAACFVFLIVSILNKQAVKGLSSSLKIGGVAIGLGMPWFIQNIVATGNPVYPFFYGILGGRGWDQWRADIYANEQASFGVGKSLASIGHAILGLGYQPGRYTNPLQHIGGGFPTGAIGFAVVLLGLIVLVSRSGGKLSRYVLAAVGVLLLMWFMLSQQSRYLTFIVVPLAIIGGSIAEHKSWKWVAWGAVFLQAIWSFYFIWTTQSSDQLRVVLGQLSPKEYRESRVGFARYSDVLNALPDTSHIILYDEVFGFLLDRKYIWGNPGHSMNLPHESSESGADFAAKIKAMGYTHIYMNLAFMDPERRGGFLASSGLSKETQPLSSEQETAMKSDPQVKWQWLVMDGLRTGSLRMGPPVRGALLLEIEPR